MPPDQVFTDADVALAWQRRAAVRAALMTGVSERMLDAARVTPGSRVLDIGTGTGDTAILAARRVGERGQVVAIDSSAQMLDAGRQLIGKEGLANVDLRVMDGSRLELPAEGFDAVIGRNAMQFLPEWPRPLDGFRRVLRPRGRLAFIVWGRPAENPFMHLLVDVVQRRGWLQDPGGLEGPFRLSNGESLANDLRNSGFADVAVESIPLGAQIPSMDPLLAYIKDGPMYRAVLNVMDQRDVPSLEADLVDAIERWRGDAGYHVRGLVLLASGSREAGHSA